MLSIYLIFYSFYIDNFKISVRDERGKDRNQSSVSGLNNTKISRAWNKVKTPITSVSCLSVRLEWLLRILFLSCGKDKKEKNKRKKVMNRINKRKYAARLIYKCINSPSPSLLDPDNEPRTRGKRRGGGRRGGTKAFSSPLNHHDCLRLHTHIHLSPFCLLIRSR